MVDLQQLRRLEPIHHLPGRNRTKADIFVYLVEGRKLALKDYSPRPFLIRHSLGRWLIRREARAYEAARDVSGVPELYGRLGPWALVIQWIDGHTLRELRNRQLDEAVFDRLEAIVETLHSRGVALADLHHRDVVVTKERRVFVVDLATAWLLGRRPGPVRRLLYRRFRDADRVSLARMRARWTGRDEAEAIAAVGAAAARWHARGRRLKRLIDRWRG